ncbi:MAG: hypothetical protein Q9P01_10390 [Anaerolineae bacterium]|nr:hypothetical protein [Anaerolineae bacterium]
MRRVGSGAVDPAGLGIPSEAGVSNPNAAPTVDVPPEAGDDSNSDGSRG